MHCLTHLIQRSPESPASVSSAVGCGSLESAVGVLLFTEGSTVSRSGRSDPAGDGLRFFGAAVRVGAGSCDEVALVGVDAGMLGSGAEGFSHPLRTVATARQSRRVLAAALAAEILS